MLKSTPSTSSRARRGFTLIEMLVVMTIIVLLVSILLPVVGIVRKRAQVAGTNALIKTLQAGLLLYQNAFDNFPPTPSNGSDDDGTLFMYLTGKEGLGLISNQGKPNEKRFAPFLKIPVEYTRHTTDNVIVVDAFGQPIKYFNCKAYVDSGKPPENCHNPDSVDLWSYGPDRVKDPDLVEPGSGPVEIPAKSQYPSNIKNWN